MRGPETPEGDRDSPAWRAGPPGWEHAAHLGRIERAAEERRRQRWTEERLGADITLQGTLATLAESGVRVTLTTVAGTRLVGRVHSVSSDAVILLCDTFRSLLPLRAVGAVRHDGALPPARDTGGRPPGEADRLIDLLSHLAVERTRVAVILAADGQQITGELIDTGSDLLVIRESPGGVAYAPLAAVTEIRLP